MAQNPPDQRLSAIRGFPSETSYRLSAASGTAFALLVLAATALLGLDFPTYEDRPSEFVRYYADDQQSIQIALLLWTFGGFAFAWYLGFLRWVFEGTERTTRGFVRATPIAFAGGIAGLAVAAVGGVAQVAATDTVGQVSPEVTRLMDLTGDYALLAASVLLTVFLLSAFFLIRVTGVLKSWLGIVAAAAVPLGFIQAVMILAPEQDDGVLGIIGFVWFLLFIVFVLGSSIELVRRKDTRLLPS